MLAIAVATETKCINDVNLCTGGVIQRACGDVRQTEASRFSLMPVNTTFIDRSIGVLLPDDLVAAACGLCESTTLLHVAVNN
jgi:hypothetical protein